MTIIHRLPALFLLLVLTVSAQAVPLQPAQINPTIVGLDSMTPVRTRDWAVHPLAPPSIISASIATGTVGVPFSYTLTATGTFPITLTATSLPTWATYDSPVISGTPDATGIYSVTLTAMNSGGTDQKTLTISIGQVFTTYVPVFLKDYPDIEKAKIVFVSDRDGPYEIYTMDVNGNNIRRLTYHEGDNINPDWSPDGTKIAFSSNRSGAYEIYTMMRMDRIRRN